MTSSPHPKTAPQIALHFHLLKLPSAWEEERKRKPMKKKTKSRGMWFMLEPKGAKPLIVIVWQKETEEERLTSDYDACKTLFQGATRPWGWQ
ncbi:transcription factor bhlh75 [Phtheirospermum japonicum]|uniref:Transcription factor bhlh75 n=1 Tax=Phtheirospermum japonicum TaxID=374723 RepID=A0A830CVA4_9LAMI|nr:transcription factor bhlh75 [Phtheirospermum japonicum]